MARLIELFQKAIAYQRGFAPFFDLSADFSWERFARLKLGNRNERVFVAEANGTVLGYIDVRAIIPGQARSRKNFVGRIFQRRIAPSFARTGTVGWIEDCYVESQFRRQGIGAALVAYGLAWLRESGADRIELATFAANGSGRAFWEKQGFSAYRLLMSKGFE
ncbi:MAG: GNAT family N-acetyltransferase [Candidatus Binatia bacterium]